jgi:hypothetical protein
MGFDKEKFLKKIIQENLLKEYYEGGDFYVYSATKEQNLNSIAKYGFERAYMLSNTNGNTYGNDAAYTTLNLSSTINNINRSGGNAYGSLIIKWKVKDINRTIVFDKEIYRKLNWGFWKPVSDQVREIIPQSEIPTLMRIKNEINHTENRTPRQTLNKNNLLTRSQAYALQAFVRSGLAKYVEGCAYVGQNDGFVYVCRNAKNLQPVSFSKDLGKTWVKIDTEKNRETTIDDVDLKYEVGHKYDEVPNFFKNDFARIMKGGKYNYLWKETYKNGPISPIWFENAAVTFDKNGNTIVVYDDYNYIIHLDNNGIFKVYDSQDKIYICELDDFKTWLETTEE